MGVLADLKMLRAELPAGPNEKWAKLKREILDTVPSVEDGVNAQRVKYFVQNLGLPVLPLIFLDTQGLKKLQKVFQDYSYRDKWVRENHFSGVFMPEIGVAFVNRFKDAGSFNGQAWERWNGSEFVEGFAVHELAHASAYHPERQLEGGQAFFNQTGFKMVDRNRGEKGVFFEEGFADLLRGRYVGGSTPRMIKLMSAGGGAISNKYLYKDEAKNLCFIKSSVSAYALELLISQKPELFGILIALRKNQNPIAELEKAFEQRYPGLFRQLFDLKDTEIDYLKGLSIVKNYLGEKGVML